MNVSLTPEIEKWIEDRVAKGFYSSASEVLRESIRLLRDHEVAQEIRRDQLHAAIDEAHASIQRGEGISPEEFKKRNQQRREAGLKSRRAA